MELSHFSPTRTSTATSKTYPAIVSRMLIVLYSSRTSLRSSVRSAPSSTRSFPNRSRVWMRITLSSFTAAGNSTPAPKTLKCAGLRGPGATSRRIGVESMAFPSASAFGPTGCSSSFSSRSYVPATFAAKERRNVPSSMLRTVTSTCRTSPTPRSRLATFGRFASVRSVSFVARSDTCRVEGSNGSYDASLFQESRVWNTNSESAPAAATAGLKSAALA